MGGRRSEESPPRTGDCFYSTACGGGEDSICQGFGTMAGDWIKMRENIHEDPAVLMMAERLGTRAEHVVGYCHRFWSWVSRNCHDGSVTDVTLESLECVLNLPGFAHMMCDAGWLMYSVDAGKPRITIPHFDRHLSDGAKKRCLNAERQRKNRASDVSRTERDKSVTREEKRREDNKYPLPPVVDAPVDAALDAAFDAWWAAAPNRVGKRDAKKSFQRAAALIAGRPVSEGPGGDDPHAFLIDRIKAFADSPKAKGEFCPHPATWLNQGRYDDDPATWMRAGSPLTVQPKRGPEMDPARARATYNPGG